MEKKAELSQFIHTQPVPLVAKQMSSDVPILVIVVFLIFFALFLFYSFLQWKMHRNKTLYLALAVVQNNSSALVENSPNQQDDIFNISSRVPQGQGQWPTHEGHLSLDHITITNELTNKSYNDEPPSYDEAMRLALSASTSPSSQEAPPPLETPKTTTAN